MAIWSSVAPGGGRVRVSFDSSVSLAVHKSSVLQDEPTTRRSFSPCRTRACAKLEPTILLTGVSRRAGDILIRVVQVVSEV